VAAIFARRRGIEAHAGPSRAIGIKYKRTPVAFMVNSIKILKGKEALQAGH